MSLAQAVSLDMAPAPSLRLVAPDAALLENVEKGLVRTWSEWEQLPPPLGEGSYAVVWRMRRKHKQPYAVKVLHGAVDASKLKDITHEFSILRALCDEWLPENAWDAEACPPIVKARRSACAQPAHAPGSASAAGCGSAPPALAAAEE